MFDSLVASTAGTRRATAVDAWCRVENAACSRRISAMVDMLDAAHAADGSADRERWCVDNWGAVSAHVGAVQRTTARAAERMLLVGVALRQRLPRVAALFAAGEIGYPLVKTVVIRTALVTDPDAQHQLDGLLAQALAVWEPLSVDKTDKAIDAIIAQVDPVAQRRTERKGRDRHVTVVAGDDGMATLFGTLFAHDAAVLDQRLNTLADTVCPADPRSRDQRRADAHGLPQGADRLPCLCQTPDCPAGAQPPAGAVVVYVVAHQDTVRDADPPTPTPAPTPTPTDPPTPADPLAPVDPPPADTADELAPGTPTDTPDPPAGTVDAADASGTPDAPDAADAGSAADSAPPDRAPDGVASEDPSACAARDSRPAESPGPAAHRAGLDGVDPSTVWDRPWRDWTWAEVTAPTPNPAQLRPGYLMGGRALPAAVSRRAAMNATLVPILHPGQAPPENRYTPSKKLADFVRARDLTCRFPGCKHPATDCDVDHTIPYPYGPTCASNLKCLCRFHHLLKTFWGGPTGWRDRQHPDGTVEWIDPDGRTHATAPGSRPLFPELCTPTTPVQVSGTPPPAHTSGLAMPKRRHTRTEDRTRRIHDERDLNLRLIEEEQSRAQREQQAKDEAAQLSPRRSASP